MIDKDALNEMQALVAVVEEQSFSAASERLSLSKSAVSKIISRLEARLRCRLLSRTTRRVQPTELGTSYFEGAKRILEQLESLEQDLENRDDRPRGLLRLSAPSILGQAIILPIVLAFQRVYPELRVELSLADRVVDLIEERIDLAVRMTHTPPPSLVAKRIGSDKRIFCASPEYLELRGLPSAPADLARHDGIHLSLDRQPVPFKLHSEKKEAQVSEYILSSRIRSSNIEAIRQAALAGFGIADLPQFLIQADLDAGRLVALLEDFQPQPRTIWAIYPPSRFIPKKVTECVAALQRGFNSSHRS